MQYSRQTTVIGAGSMGLFAAFWLARRGEEVLVLDKGAPMREASGVNAGSLAIQNKLLPLIPLTRAALERWAGMDELLGADVGYRRVGGLRIATSESEIASLRQGFEAQCQAGLQLEWLQGADVQARAPYLSTEVRAATYCAADSYADPLHLAPALLHAVEALGVEVRSGTEVTAVEGRGAGFLIRTDQGEYQTKRLLIAAGAWSQSVGAQLGLHLPVALDVNIVAVSEPRPAVMGEVVTHVRGILTLKQVRNGTFLIGGGWQGAGDLATGRKEIDYESSLHNMRLAVRVVPDLKAAVLVRQWAGFEGVTPDSLPYVGRVPGTSEGYVLACARGGWTLAPELSRATADLMLDGHADIPLARFRPERCARG